MNKILLGLAGLIYMNNKKLLKDDKRKYIDDTIKIGILLGFSGPIESLTPAMSDSVQLALDEATNSGLFLGGKKIKSIKGDTTCIDTAAAISEADRLLSKGVIAIIGGDCSGVTEAIAKNVTIKNKIPLISPSATSPKLTELKDNGLFFRTSPSDTKIGIELAELTKKRSIKNVAITYTNNSSQKFFANVYKTHAESIGINVTDLQNHEDGKMDYSDEVANLKAAGGDALVVMGYLNQGGKKIIEASIDDKAFDTFILGEGMIGESLTNYFGKKLDGSFGILPGLSGKGAVMFEEVAVKNRIYTGPYTGQSYDAAALIVLAIHAANSIDGNKIAEKIQEIANGSGTEIYPGEIAKGLKLLNNGIKINYKGATNINFTDIGEDIGDFLEQEIENGEFKTINYD